MSNGQITWASGPFDGDMFGTLEVLEQAVPVGLIATFEPDLVTCDHADLVPQVLARPDTTHFDHIPVRHSDGSIVGVLDRHGDHPPDARAAAVMRPLHQTLLISSNSGILSFVEEAHEHPFRLVLKGSSICGVVTLSDLQKLAVRPVLFYRITHLELLLAEWLRRHEPNDAWIQRLTPEQKKKISHEWTKKSRENLAIDKLSCTDLSHKIDAILKCNTQSRIFADDNIAHRLEQVRILRNALCHASDYALTRANAVDTAQAARTAREIIEELQTLLGYQRDRVRTKEDLPA